MKKSQNINATPLISLHAAVVDTETTGLNVKEDRIVQIGGVHIEGMSISGENRLDVLVNPGLPIPQASSKIHGIYDKDVKDVGQFASVAEILNSFLDGRILIGHNIGFDIAILEQEYERVGLYWQEILYLDTMILGRCANPRLPDHSLETLSTWLQIDIQNRHTALGDAQATAEVFLGLVPHLKDKGIRTLAEAYATSAQSSEIIETHLKSGWKPPLSDQAGDLMTYQRVAAVDSLPFRLQVKDLMSSPAITISPSTTILEATRTLVEKNISSVFVKPDDPGQAWGIATERDLMRVLVRPQDAERDEIREIMSFPLESIDQDAFVYMAISRMHRNGIRHLGVRDSDGVIVGSLSSGDLIRERASDALVLTFDLETVQNESELGHAWSRLPVVISALLSEEVGATDITAIIAEQICAATRRAGELALAEMREQGRGDPPTTFSLLVLGSAGRGESLLKPDQDNALIYSLSESELSAEETDQWYEDFATRIARILDSAGIPYCDGGVMAKNSKWRNSLRGWFATVDNWLNRFSPEDLLSTDIFFDYKPVLGDFELAYKLWNYAYDQARDATGFLGHMSNQAQNISSPIGLFGQIKTNQGTIDLKKHGLFPMVSGARALALRHGIKNRATRKRLRGVIDTGKYNENDIQNIIDARDIFVRELLRTQVRQIESGEPLNNEISLGNLTKSRRVQLKWALNQVDILNAIVLSAR